MEQSVSTQPPAACKEAGLKGEVTKMKAFRLTGLILGIVGTAISVTAIVFSAVGMSKARECKQCKLGGRIK